MRLEYFIAKRIATTKGSTPSVIVHIAALSVALSVAVMLISLAVIFGFDSQLRSNLMAVDAHITVKDYRGTSLTASPSITHSDELVELIKGVEGYQSHTSYALSGVIFRHRGNVEGAMLRGVDTLFDWGIYREGLLRGELPRLQREGEVRTKDILISGQLASALAVDVGERLELLYTTSGEALSRDLYRVCGVYSTGIEESDRLTALCDIASLRRTMNWENNFITGYHVTLCDVDRVEGYAQSLNHELLYMDDPEREAVVAYTFEELNPYIMSWLSTHDVNAAVIISIMLIVAALNMASALLIMVLERRRMVGVLKSLGMSSRALGRLFIIRSLYIIVSGVLWGNVIGIGLSLIQKVWQPLKLDSGGYLLSAIPIELGVGWILLLNVAVVAAIVVLIIIPSRFVTRVEMNL